MIFESVNKISNKKAFIELILIYIRMVEVIAYRNNKTIALISEPSDIICDELKDMGVIESSNDIPILKKQESLLLQAVYLARSITED